MTDEYTEQRAWERDMTSLGVARFRAQESNALEGGRYTDTSAGSRLLRVFLSQVSEDIGEQISNVRRRSMYLKLLRGIDLDKLAMFTLHRVIECIYKPATIQKVAAGIGKMVEDELRFSKFEIEKPEFYNALIRDMESKKTTGYKHRHRVLVNRMNAEEIEWQTWTNETHIGVGLILLGCAERASDLIVRGKRNGAVTIEPSPEVLEWIQGHDESIEIMLPDRMPCLVKPRDWTDWKDGGFYTSRLRSLTPLVKTRSGQQRDTQGPLLDTCAMPTILKSVNAMQGTSWQINRRVLATVREVWERGLEIGMPRSTPYEIPPAPIAEGKRSGDLQGPEKIRFEEWKAEARTLHGLEGERKSALMSIVRAMRMAARLDHLDLMWMVYQLDFRSRTYTTTSGVSPQGSDVSKALLQFGEAKVLGERGWYWFQVHGANKYGYDKEHYDERVVWVEANSDAFERAGRDPMANTDVWKGADKPYQFLAWCIEYAAACSQEGGPTNFASRTPVALDGSCNGLQHFSAMLRDKVGGTAVNLVPSRRGKPSDIYQDVADVTTEALRAITLDPAHEHYALAANWLGLFGPEGMSRKLSKKPVMTLPYGSTMQTCTQSIYSWYIEQKSDYFPDNTAFKHSIFLSKILWESIGKVVVAARAAMDWLQKCASILAKHDEPIIYTTPIGFPMVQFAPKMDKKQIHAQIGGNIKVAIKTEMPGVDSYKARSGVSPNFVHPLDATHMHMCVSEGVDAGFTHFAMIHDDFGVHACYIDMWHVIIREQFVKLHTDNDVLADFKRENEERTGLTLPEPPKKGDLDLSEVCNSLFFFG